MKGRPRQIRPMLFGIASWLPVAFALALILERGSGVPGTEKLERVLIGYAVAVLGFVGGARFGFHTATPAHRPLIERLAPAVALIGLAALVLPVPFALAVLIVGFAAAGALDAFSAFRGRLPQDYARARSVMTMLFALTLLAILVLLEPGRVGVVQ